MLNRLPGIAALALALGLPIAALADVNGSEVLRPSFEFDFDTGTQGTSLADIQWNATGSSRSISAVGSAKLFNLGNIGSSGFAALTSSSLINLPYAPGAINGTTDSSNLLVQGDVFAVLTNGGSYAKVLVTGFVTDPGSASLQDIQLQYYTYARAFTHLAMGPLGSDVWTTAITLNNTTSTSATFTITFYQDGGQALSLGNGFFSETQGASTVENSNGQSVSGTIPPKGNAVMVLSATTFLGGWATLTGPGVTGQAVFHRHTSNNAEYEAAVPVATGGTEFLVPFDATFYVNGSKPTTIPYITGMALANLDPSNSATISCSIFDPAGRSMGSGSPITIPPLGHTALQLNADSGFGNVSSKIGSLDCSSLGTSFAVLGLRFLGSNDVTSFAAILVQ